MPIFIGGILVLILLLAFLWGNSLIRDTRIQSQMQPFILEIKELQQENKRLQREVLSLQSPQKRDKRGKEDMNRRQTEEQEIKIILPKKQATPLHPENTELLEREVLLSRPIREQWILFFFGEK